MPNIEFHIENGVQSGILPAALIVRCIDPIHLRETKTLKHNLAKAGLN